MFVGNLALGKRGGFESLGASAVAPVITSSAPAAPAYGVAYSHTFTATGTPAPTWSVTVGSLPSWASLDANTGVLSGTPDASGSWSFTVTATNSAGTADQAVSWTITYADKVLSYSPVQFLKLTDASGAEDSSGNGRTGTVSGANPQATATPFGDNCYSFDGINDAITISNDLDFGTGDFTIMIWAKWVSKGSAQVIHDVLTSGGKQVLLTTTNPSDGQFAYSINATPHLWSGTTDTTWHMFAVKRTSGVWKIFKDTSSTSISPGSFNVNFNTARLGSRASPQETYWAGSLSYFAVFNSALSDAAITALATP